MSARPFIIRCAADAVVSERWRVMASSPEEALARFHDNHESVTFEERIGCDDEENRRDFEVEEAEAETLRPFTVIWRPAWGDAFRGDHVFAESDDVEIIMDAAFAVVREEMGEQGSTEEEISEVISLDETYDLCAILAGHSEFVF